MAKALEISIKEQEANQKCISDLKNLLINQLIEIIPDIQFNGGCETGGLYSLISATFPNRPGFELLANILDMNGICVHDGHGGDLNK